MHFASRAGEIDKLSKGVGRANKFSICFSRCSRAGEERSQALPRRITSRENRKLSEDGRSNFICLIGVQEKREETRRASVRVFEKIVQAIKN